MTDEKAIIVAMARNEGDLGAVQSRGIFSAGLGIQATTTGQFGVAAMSFKRQTGSATIFGKDKTGQSSAILGPIACAIVDSNLQKRQVQNFITRLNSVVLVIKPVVYSYTIGDYVKSNLGKTTSLDGHVNADFAATLKHFYRNNNNAPRNPNQ
ncbi:unnamed protein product [Adineta ricciae]|uniref:Uncharacterized protein n=1 Tax=Adineta ricciae TaxID=249248 RepID=A0A816A9C1_ADIRI|nr:unnamed protein product [Adineta ricciae]CAF1592957.1 unnamed protein product [Adineta ricciae]